jgi:hypothetical protein
MALVTVDWWHGTVGTHAHPVRVCVHVQVEAWTKGELSSSSTRENWVCRTRKKNHCHFNKI